MNVQLGSSEESVRDKPKVANKETEFFKTETELNSMEDIGLAAYRSTGELCTSPVDIH